MCLCYDSFILVYILVYIQPGPVSIIDTERKAERKYRKEGVSQLRRVTRLRPSAS